MQTKDLRNSMRILCRKANLSKPYSPYSLRRGAATMAALEGWAPEEIQFRLRHESWRTSILYIDRDAMFEIARTING
jgi:integrase